MNAKRMLLRFLIGNGTYDRLVRMNVIQDAGVVGRRARGHVRNVNDCLFDEPVARSYNSTDAVPDHLRLQMLGELPRHSMVDFDYGLPTKM